MPLVDVRGFDVGSQSLPRFQLGQRQGLALQQAQQQAAQQGQEQRLRGQLLGVQQAPVTPQQQLGAPIAQPPITGQQAAPVAPVAPVSTPPSAPQLTDDQALAQLFVKNPELGETTLNQMGLIDQTKRNEAANFAFRVQDLSIEQQDVEIKRRAEQIVAQTGDPSAARDTLSLLEIKDPELRKQAYKTVQLAVLSPEARAKIAGGGGKGANLKSFAPVTIVNPETDEKRLVSPTVDPRTGEGRLSPFDLPAGFEISKETSTEKRQADILAAGAKKKQEITAKGQTGRRQLAIDRGLDAADGFANVQRAIELLDTIETGGFDAASLRAKQLFGVEGADEGELSNLMGKAVLAQLKATFGAAFTKEEGAKLERLDAGFSKSPEANKRILGQTKRLILRAAKRGIRAARAEGDLDTVADIEESLQFRLGEAPAGEAAITQPQPAAQPSAPIEGDLTQAEQAELDQLRAARQ